MSAVTKRIYQENLALRDEMETLRQEVEGLQRDKNRFELHAKLAYLEGIDQGRAQVLDGVAS